MNSPGKVNEVNATWGMKMKWLSAHLQMQNNTTLPYAPQKFGWTNITDTEGVEYQ